MSGEALVPQIRAALAVAPGLADYIGPYERVDECDCCGAEWSYCSDPFPIRAFRAAWEVKMARYVERQIRIAQEKLDVRRTAFAEHLSAIGGLDA